MLKAVQQAMLHGNSLARGTTAGPVRAARASWGAWHCGAAPASSDTRGPAAAASKPRSGSLHRDAGGDAAGLLARNRTQLAARLTSWQCDAEGGRGRRSLQPMRCSRWENAAPTDSAGSPVGKRKHLGSRLLGTSDVVQPKYLGSALLQQPQHSTSQQVSERMQRHDPPHQEGQSEQMHAFAAVSASMSRSSPIVAAATLLGKYSLAEVDSISSSATDYGALYQGDALHVKAHDDGGQQERWQHGSPHRTQPSMPPSQPSAGRKQPRQSASMSKAAPLVMPASGTAASHGAASQPHTSASQQQLAQQPVQQQWQSWQRTRQDTWQKPGLQPQQQPEHVVSPMQQQHARQQRRRRVQSVPPPFPKPPAPSQRQPQPQAPRPAQRQAPRDEPSAEHVQPVNRSSSRPSPHTTSSPASACNSSRASSSTLQNEPDPGDVLDDLAEQLEERGIELDSVRFGTHRTVCPVCAGGSTGESAFAITVTETSALWLCHRATCGFKGGVHARLGGTNCWQGARNHQMRLEPEKVIWPQTHQLKPLNRELLAWFNSRGISQSTLTDRRNRITMELRPAIGGSNHESKVATIAFPFIRDGNVVNIKYRQLPKKFSQSKGGERVLYGIDDIKGQSFAILVEGENDKLALNEAGFWNVASVPNGALLPGNENKLGFLESAEAALAGCNMVVLATDADEPGQALAAQLAQRLGRARCGCLQWPDGCKDANDVLMHHCAAFLREWVLDGSEHLSKQRG